MRDVDTVFIYRFHPGVRAGAENDGSGNSGEVAVPDLVGMTVPDARQAGHRAGLVVISGDLDGTPLGGLAWPGVWVVTAQFPTVAARLNRWDTVVIEFEEVGGRGSAGDREPRIPLPDPSAVSVEREPPTESR
jgi:hypothetical protein